MGRPCEYCERSEEIDKLSLAYIGQANNTDKPRMVYINELALILKIDRDRIQDWSHKKKEDGSLEHPNFNRIIKELETSQELRLQQRLMARYNPTGAIFLLKTKHKYIETEKKLLGGDSHEPLEIRIIDEKALPENVE